jgi:phosphotransacetylase
MTSADQSIGGFEQVRALVRRRLQDRDPVRTALVVPSSGEALKAVALAAAERLVAPVIVGDAALTQKTAQECGADLSGAEFIDLNQPDMAMMTAFQMAARGEIEAIVKGRGSTVDFLHHMLSDEAGFVRRGCLVMHVAGIRPARYDRMLFVTDAAVVPQPDLKAKVAMLGNLTNVCQACGLKCPRIAVLAAVEVVYPQMPATLDAAVLDKMADRGQITGAYIDGPLSFDCAVDRQAAEAKGITDSAVAGQADAMLAPNIETANGILKGMMLYGDAEVGGVLVGGIVPVVISTRYEEQEARYRSLLMALALATV